jgi:hypothetical protein
MSNDRDTRAAHAAATDGDCRCLLCVTNRPRTAPVDVLPCPRCEQLAAPGTGAICNLCRELEHEPQGTTVRLFTPAPTVPAGSLTMF